MYLCTVRSQTPGSISAIGLNLKLLFLKFRILYTASAALLGAAGSAMASNVSQGVESSGTESVDTLLSLPQVSVTAIKGGALANHDEAVTVIIDLTNLAFFNGLELSHSKTLHFPYSVGIFSFGPWQAVCRPVTL